MESRVKTEKRIVSILLIALLCPLLWGAGVFAAADDSVAHESAASGQEAPEGDDPSPQLPLLSQTAEEDEDKQTFPDPPPLPEDDGCNTIAELVALLEKDEGGTVTVTGDLALAQGEDVYIKVEKPVNVDLGEHSIIIPPKTFLTLQGPITLEGRGAQRSLIQVSGGLTTCAGAELWMRGDDAVTLDLAEGGFWNGEKGTCGALGNRACAVSSRSQDPLTFFQTRLVAEGEDAVCVRSSGPVRLVLCQVESGGIIAEAPSLLLDGCSARPEQEDGTVIRRVAILHSSLPENGLWIDAGSPAEELKALMNSFLNGNFEYGIYNEKDAGDAILLFTQVDWTHEEVDLSKPGYYRFLGKPMEQGVGGVTLPNVVFYLHVADPKLPGLESAYPRNEGIIIHFYCEVVETEDFTLWYSTDEGETWQDASALPGADINTKYAELPELPLVNRDYLFRLTVDDGPMAGTSNTLRYLHYENGWGAGGNRDYDDRDYQGQLPPAQIQPPPDPGDSTGDSGNAGGSSRPGGSSKPDENEDKDNGSEQPVDNLNKEGEPILENAAPGLTEPVSPQETPRIPEFPGLAANSMSEAPPASLSSPPKAAQVERGYSFPNLFTSSYASAQTLLPGEASVSVTGRDLAAQRQANSQGVTLHSGGLKVTLPHTLLDGLSLAAEDVVTLLLHKPDTDSFEVRLWAKGEEVTEFEDGTYTASIPFEAEEQMEVFCTGTDGTEYIAKSFEEGTAVFDLEAFGGYTLEARTRGQKEAELGAGSQPVAEDAGMLATDLPAGISRPFLWLLILVAGALVAAVFFLRRRRKRGRSC